MSVSRRSVLVALAGLAGCSSAAKEPMTTARPPVTPTPTPKRPEEIPIDLREWEQRWHRKENALRQEHGLDPYAWDTQLAEIARAHSRDMLARDYYHHVSPDDVWPSDRVRRAGYAAENVNENIQQGGGHYRQMDEEYLVDMFETMVGSKAHRLTMLSKELTHHGVGIAAEWDGRTVLLRLTDLFALPR